MDSMKAYVEGMFAAALGPLWNRGPEPIEHDYTKWEWGRSFYALYISNDKRHIKASGHGRGLRRGDAVRIRMASGRLALYRIEEIQYERDPADMWYAEFSFLGYAEPLGGQD